MIIDWRCGHLYNTDQGASGVMLEADFNREYGPAVAAYLASLGHTMVDCTPTSAVSMGDSLYQGVFKAISSHGDLFVSFHGNAYPGGAGSEVVCGSQKGITIGNAICANLANLGFKNRGAYMDVRGLYEIHNTPMTAIIVEPLFVDNADDIARYRADKAAFAKAIGDGILAGFGLSGAIPVSPIPSVVSTSDSSLLAFQKCANLSGLTDVHGNRLSEDGYPGPKTSEAISKVNLTKGANSSLVAWIQGRLAAKGFACGGADGDFGGKTLAAVIAFQSAMGLAADGIVGPRTVNALI